MEDTGFEMGKMQAAQALPSVQIQDTPREVDVAGEHDEHPHSEKMCHDYDHERAKRVLYKDADLHCSVSPTT